MLSAVSIRRAEGSLYAIALALPVLAWLIPWVVARMEAWDHWSYFWVSLPVMIAFAGYAAFVTKSRTWRWPVVLLLAQSAVSFALIGPGNLFPLSLIVFVILAVPSFIAVLVASHFAKRQDEQHAS
jgi:peptidoglycan/LPS O-acetylase OafA/YrhL